MILTSDTHFTSNDADAYRWALFEDLSRLFKSERDKRLYILGDLTDRRDRHPSDLVNQLIDRFNKLVSESVKITIIMGNHDRAQFAGKPYWAFLSSIPDVTFVHKPTAEGKLLLLPWTKDPVTEWMDITRRLYNAAFCHQTFDGSHMGGDRIHEASLTVDDVFPDHMKVYSGDVHIPQTIKHLTYVGSPHPIKYGDDYRCRVLVLDNAFQITEDVTLYPPAKRTITIRSVDDLAKLSVRSGDSAKVRISLAMSRMAEWTKERDAIEAWAKQRGVTIAGIEPTVEIAPRSSDATVEMNDPFEVLDAYAAAEGIEDEVLTKAFELMEEARGT